MSMIALGFATRNPSPPAGLILRSRAGLHVVGGEKSVLADERSRLTALQTCYDAGLDVLPFSVRQPVSIAIALECARLRNHEIRNALADIEGNGQLSLSLKTPQSETMGASDGRVWLASRAREASAIKDLGHWLETLAGRTPYVASPLHTTRQLLTIALLVPRAELARSTETLQAILPQQPALPWAGARLSVSGLWPALGFSKLVLDQIDAPK